MQNDWIVPGESTPALVENTEVSNPVITAAMVDDLEGPNGVADPFMVKDGDRYYIFHEVIYDSATKQALNYSYSDDDGATWQYGSKMTGFDASDNPDLDPAIFGGVSYPYVFKCDGVWYMIPSVFGMGVYLWIATSFPGAWVRYKKLLTLSFSWSDCTVFQYGGLWWLYLYGGVANETHLYYCDMLYGRTYTAHPSNPILTGIANSRPAGRPLVRANSVDIFMQKNDVYYGEKVRAYQLTDLTTTTVTVTELAVSPILEGSGGVGDWNRYGLHTLDRVNSLLSVVDGEAQEGGGWSIGLYKDAPE